jgi:hypothetical protein
MAYDARPADCSCSLDLFYRARPRFHVLLLTLRACSAQIEFFKDSLGSTLDPFLADDTLTHSIAPLDRSLHAAFSCTRFGPPSHSVSLTLRSFARSLNTASSGTRLALSSLTKWRLS